MTTAAVDSAAPRESAETRRLRADGYCVLRGAMGRRDSAVVADEIAPLLDRAPLCDGLFYGYRTKRVHGLLKRAPATATAVLQDAVVGIAESILLPGCDNIQLNLTQAIEIQPGELAQLPHRDHHMWPGDKRGAQYMLNVMWPLDEFTQRNGGTRVWPGTHLHDAPSAPEEDAVTPELRPGDALIFLGATLHGGGANRSARPRRGLLVSYCLGWLKPYENMWLTYPPEVARGFSPELRDLIGYRRHRPNLGNYDGQCPSVLFDSELPEFLSATDALAPGQQAVLKRFADRQRAVRQPLQ